MHSFSDAGTFHTANSQLQNSVITFCKIKIRPILLNSNKTALVIVLELSYPSHRSKPRNPVLSPTMQCAYSKQNTSSLYKFSLPPPSPPPPPTFAHTPNTIIIKVQQLAIAQSVVKFCTSSFARFRPLSQCQIHGILQNFTIDILLMSWRLGTVLINLFPCPASILKLKFTL